MLQWIAILDSYEEYRRLGGNSSRREHRHNGGAVRFFHEKRDICGVGEPACHPPSRYFGSFHRTDTSYLITGHKSPGERSGGTAPSRAVRFPLVNHGKPYIIGKQRAYGVHRRGAWLSVRGAGCSVYERVHKSSEKIRPRVARVSSRKKHLGSDSSFARSRVPKDLVHGSSTGRDSI